MRDGYYGIDGLMWQLRAEDRDTVWREYTATLLNALGKMQAKSGTWKFPSFVDIIHPNSAARTRDNRSGKEILDALKKRLESG